jgi:hypothetical protein
MEKIRVIITASWEVMANGVIEVTSVRFPGENRRSQAPESGSLADAMDATPLSWVLVTGRGVHNFIYVRMCGRRQV